MASIKGNSLPLPSAFSKALGDAMSEVPAHPQEMRHHGMTHAINAVAEDDDHWYGWVCTVSIFLINAHTWGVNAAYGVFLAYYLSSDLFPGATELSFAFIGGLSISAGFVLSPLIDLSVMYLGLRASLLLGVLLESVAFLASSFASQVWQLFLAQGVAFGCGMGLLYLGTAGFLPQWIKRRSGLANSLASSGSGTGGLVYSLVVERLLVSLGYARALQILAAIIFGVTTVAVLLLKERHPAKRAPRSAYRPDLLRKASFLLLCAFGFLSIFAYTICLFLLPTYATSIGLSSSQGSVIAAVLSVGQIVGRPIIGFLGDRYDRLVVSSIATLLAGVFTLAVWIVAKSYAVLLVYSAMVGLVAGTLWAVITPITAEVMGLQVLAPALTMQWLVFSMPATFGAAVALQMTISANGSYLGAQILTGCLYIAAAGCLLAVRLQRGRKQSQMFSN